METKLYSVFIFLIHSLFFVDLYVRKRQRAKDMSHIKTEKKRREEERREKEKKEEKKEEEEK